jgi:hypothetical protein
MSKKLLNLILLVNLNSASEKSVTTSRQKAISKLLASLPVYLQRADLGRIKIEPSVDGKSFTIEIFYKSLPQDSVKSLGQLPAVKTSPALGSLAENAQLTTVSSVNHLASLCKCSRCEYIRNSDK